MSSVKMRRILAAVLAMVLAAALTGTAAADGGHEEAKAAAVGYLMAAVEEKCPVQTYETEDPLIASAAYTYESALAALALLSEGETEAAAKILDAMVAGMEADQEFGDRFRNAHMAGSAADLPGYWSTEKEQWLQDAYQVGTGTKSSAAAAVALLTYCAAEPNEDYLNAAAAGVNWILNNNCRDGKPGYTSGYSGWPKVDGACTVMTFRTTVDNLWLAAACRMLAEATGWSIYSEAEASALRFVKESMFSSGDTRYFQGTKDDGVTPVTGLILTDVQVLAELCMDDDAGMDNIEKCRAADGGYSYDNSATGGSLLENTAMAALALKLIGETEKAEAALTMMEGAQLPSGAFPQASVPELKTGEKDTVFRDWPSVGPCAWFILAVNGINPLRGK